MIFCEIFTHCLLDFGGQVLVWHISDDHNTGSKNVNRHTPLNAIRLMYPVRAIAWRKAIGSGGTTNSTNEQQPVMVGLLDGSIYSWQPLSPDSTADCAAALTNAVTCLVWERSSNPERLAASSTGAHSYQSR